MIFGKFDLNSIVVDGPTIIGEEVSELREILLLSFFLLDFASDGILNSFQLLIIDFSAE